MVWGLGWFLPHLLKAEFVTGLTFCPGIDYLVIFHIFSLAEPGCSAPSFLAWAEDGWAAFSHLHCGLWTSVLSLLTLGLGYRSPSFPGAALSTVCVSVGQKLTWGPCQPRRFGPYQKETSCLCSQMQSQLLVRLWDVVKDIRPSSLRSYTIFCL